ncbi:hypothetical protein CLOP_g8326 [Closterium sp. NIES-67]|nr:hypothetical protein CLOP_g8326 [Closterium sp. NIES-67]
MDDRKSKTKASKAATAANGGVSGSGLGLGSTGDAPSEMTRRDVLDIVRKHSDALPRPGAAQPGAAPSSAQQGAQAGQGAQGQAQSGGGAEENGLDTASVLMDGRYWQQMLELYFVRDGARSQPGGKGGKGGKAGGGEGGNGAGGGEGEGSKGEGENEKEEKGDALFDDMLFFVRQEKSTFGQILNFIGSLMQADGPQNEEAEKAKPFFVRRWGPDLARVVGESADEVDWRRSFYLNLICHTEFTLTVAICSRQDLEAHRRSSKAPVHPISKVTKRVFASPSKARIDIDTSKAQETLPSFPDICFAVDDYDNTFEAVVLEDPDHCFCVMLNAHGGAAFPPDDVVEKVNPDGSRRVFKRGTSSEATALGEATDGQPKITLFSGFVSYPLVRSAFQGGSTGFSMWGQTQPAKPEKLVMRGPGGRGEADVAVSLVLPAPEVHAEEAEKKRRPRERKKKDGENRHRPSLSELQGKLWTVQSELMGLVEAQQQQEEVEKDKGKGKGKEVAEEAEERRRKKEENQQRLRELQVELKSVQEQLQKLGGGEGTGSPKYGDKSSGGSGSGGGSRGVVGAVVVQGVVSRGFSRRWPRPLPVARCCTTI